jgi:hypothetical protein
MVKEVNLNKALGVIFKDFVKPNEHQILVREYLLFNMIDKISGISSGENGF